MMTDNLTLKMSCPCPMPGENERLFQISGMEENIISNSY